MENLITMTRYLGFSTAAVDDGNLYNYLAHGSLTRWIDPSRPSSGEISIRRTSAKVERRFIVEFNRRKVFRRRANYINDAELRFDVPEGTTDIWLRVLQWIDKNIPSVREKIDKDRSMAAVRQANRKAGYEQLSALKAKLPGYELDPVWSDQSELEFVTVNIRVPFTTVDEVVKRIEEITRTVNRGG